MIRFERVSVTYAAAPVLREVNLSIDEGELCLVIGQTGAGKSTLLGAINGLVPHFTGGTLAGRVSVAGRDTSEHPPREFADLVGVVGQDPVAGFVTDTVEEELAYGMEQLALAPSVMRTRVEETLDLMGLADLRRRGLSELSGGQQQRVAIAAALTAHPRVLVLDEPTSALDPTGAEDVLAAITRLVHDLGVTVILAEHRLERVIPYADRVIYLPGDATVQYGEPAAILAKSKIAPPLVRLGRVANWSPLPLSVRDARRQAASLRAELPADPPVPHRESFASSTEVLTAEKIVVWHGSIPAVRGVDVSLRAGQVTALMGRNGSGKSSLLWALHGRAKDLVGLVPQTATDLLYLDTVDAELAEAGADTARTLLDAIVPGIPGDAHPRDLSAGQQLALVLAIQLAAKPSVVLLDEPTRGLDYDAKAGLAQALDSLAAQGKSIVVATHDVEFAATVADRVIVLAEGEVVADGPAPAVLTASPSFAPQIAKVLAPLAYLTLRQVTAALRPGEREWV